MIVTRTGQFIFVRSFKDAIFYGTVAAYKRTDELFFCNDWGCLKGNVILESLE